MIARSFSMVRRSVRRLLASMTGSIHRVDGNLHLSHENSPFARSPASQNSSAPSTVIDFNANTAREVLPQLLSASRRVHKTRVTPSMKRSKIPIHSCRLCKGTCGKNPTGIFTCGSCRSAIPYAAGNIVMGVSFRPCLAVSVLSVPTVTPIKVSSAPSA